ncbi:ankyrin [Rhizoclosmatium globosum]|uniref:Ankyrin n=1 Tax=Rhizoclosmatium globosum TaxID=329046 RepID=A0A1Y2CWT3_9FUNG|nr:ankyrin [Rhizoclosmatium globosum]|eukprot:ORY51346.1 ankyrin [Rhizoclosmatium globosum]
MDSVTSGHSHSHSRNCKCADHAPVNPSVTQTLAELDFERSLHNAALVGNLAKLNKLATRENVNSYDQSGYTALHYAARNGHVECVKALIALGTDVDLRTVGLGTTALMRAVLGRSTGVVEVLLLAGADVGIKDGDRRDCFTILNGMTGDKVQEMKALIEGRRRI